MDYLYTQFQADCILWLSEYADSTQFHHLRLLVDVVPSSTARRNRLGNACSPRRYFADLSSCAIIHKVVQGITQAAARIAGNVNKCIEAWRLCLHTWKSDEETFTSEEQDVSTFPSISDSKMPSPLFALISTVAGTISPALFVPCNDGIPDGLCEINCVVLCSLLQLHLAIFVNHDTMLPSCSDEFGAEKGLLMRFDLQPV